MNNYDEAFNSAKLIPAAHLFLKNWTASSKQFQKRFKKDSKAQLDMPYGDKSSMRMDIFSPGAYVEANLLFVHGGFWTGYDKSVFSHLGMGPILNNVRCIFPNLPKPPDVSLPEMRVALSECIANIARKYSGPIILLGHQSGAQLAGQCITSENLSDELAARINHTVLISPISDLRPIFYSKYRDEIGLTEELAQLESPLLHAKHKNVKVTIWVGSDERAIYIDQAQQLATAWKCGWFKSNNRHHFDIIEDLEKQNSKLTTMVLTHLHPH